MSMYGFLNNEEKMVKVNLNSWKEAKEYATNNNLMCLCMKYEDFIKAFDNKINKLREHKNFCNLLEKAEWAKINNTTCGLDSIIANDFMKRIITMPLDYIKNWLEDKNNLEWLAEYKYEY